MNRFLAICFLGTVALIVLSLLALPALAETKRLSSSKVTIRETTEPGAVAELFFENSTGDGYLESRFDLTLGGIVCNMYMQVGRRDPDTIEPECAGYVAVPRRLTIPDGTEGRILLIPLNHVGF